MKRRAHAGLTAPALTAPSLVPAEQASRIYWFADDTDATARRADWVELRSRLGPAKMPVEQISTTRLAINLKTAHALGIKVPDSIRLRADETIE
jgi:hypothetical protein